MNNTPPEKCPACDGTGTCPFCGGDGLDDQLEGDDKTCSECDGGGDCPDCNGEGTL